MHIVFTHGDFCVVTVVSEMRTPGGRSGVNTSLDDLAADHWLRICFSRKI